MTQPLPHDELIALATANRSVNAHLAAYFELRWHDPFFIAAWQRFNVANAVWQRTWPHVDFKYLKGIKPGHPVMSSGVAWPDAAQIPAGPQRDAAAEYMAAKDAYHAALDHYAGTDRVAARRAA